MKASFTLAAALVGALAFGPAHAGAGPNQLHSSTSLLTLVAEGGGGTNSIRTLKTAVLNARMHSQPAAPMKSMGGPFKTEAEAHKAMASMKECEG
jgi:hypothetical protein